MTEVEQANELKLKFEELRSEISKVIVGQDEVIKLVLTSVFCQGHSLLVGVPGLAKTLLVKTISEVLDLKFSRIQFTPDLMPSDIIGSETLTKDKEFKFIEGPIFTNIVLADEINRTPPKTQAALLEAMQERNVTVAGVSRPLGKPFFVLATQNPIEQEGTYPLPEAQLDRFMFNIELDYPTYEEEIAIMKATTGTVDNKVRNILNATDILNFQELVKKVPVSDNLLEYAVQLVQKTRKSSNYANDVTREFIEWGAGPRAAQFLIKGAKCNALLKGKYSPDIEDIKEIAIPILKHRVVRNFKAAAEGISVDEIIKKLL